MVTEKGFTLAEALVTLSGGGSRQKVVSRYRGMSAPIFGAGLS
jgi:hypothetical protein